MIVRENENYDGDEYNFFERQKSERWRKPNKLSDETNERGKKRGKGDDGESLTFN